MTLAPFSLISFNLPFNLISFSKTSIPSLAEIISSLFRSLPDGEFSGIKKPSQTEMVFLYLVGTTGFKPVPTTLYEIFLNSPE